MSESFIQSFSTSLVRLLTSFKTRFGTNKEAFQDAKNKDQKIGHDDHFPVDYNLSQSIDHAPEKEQERIPDKKYGHPGNDKEGTVCSLKPFNLFKYTLNGYRYT